MCGKYHWYLLMITTGKIYIPPVLSFYTNVYFLLFYYFITNKLQLPYFILFLTCPRQIHQIQWIQQNFKKGELDCAYSILFPSCCINLELDQSELQLQSWYVNAATLTGESGCRLVEERLPPETGSGRSLIRDKTMGLSNSRQLDTGKSLSNCRIKLFLLAIVSF